MKLQMGKCFNSLIKDNQWLDDGFREGNPESKKIKALAIEKHWDFERLIIPGN